MRILVPSIIDPAWFRGGAATATEGLLSVLAAEPLGASIELLPSPLPRHRWRHTLRQATSAVRSLASPLPAKVLFQISRRYVASLRTALDRGDHDLVLVNGTDLLWVNDLVGGRAPVVAWAHNLEHQLFARQLETIGRRTLVGRILGRDVSRLKSFEIDGLARVDGAVFLSSNEARTMRRHLRQQAILTVPPLFAYPAFDVARRRRPGARLELGFLANYGWWPNRDAIDWLLAEVLPHCEGAVRLNLFGIGAERYLRTARQRGRNADGVVAHGFAANLDTVWRACDVMVCPIRTGAGVNMKLAESVYNGMPVLATPFAVDGLPLEPGPALGIAEKADAWVEFLRSEGARELAAARVSVAQRRRFSAAEHQGVIHDFFRRMARQPSTGSGDR